MSRALFICQVVLNARGAAYPATEDIRGGPTGNFPCSWTITSFNDSRRVAVGIAEVDASQLSALQADSRIRAVNLPSNWESLTWGSIAVATRNSILTFLSNQGVSTTGITNATTLVTVVSTLCDRFRAGRTLNHIRQELLSNFGVQ